MPDAAPPRRRVLLLTYPGLFGARIIAELMAADGIALAGIGLSGRIFKNKGHLRSSAHFLARTGLSYSLYNFLLTDAAWTQLKIASRLGAALRAADTRVLTDCNDAATIAWARGLAPDYIVSCYFNQKIGAGLIAAPRLRCINAHPALLPAHRGPEPVLRALAARAPQTGVTVHAVDESIDTGPILLQEVVAVPTGATHFSLSALLWTRAADLLRDFIAKDDGRVGGIVQPDRRDPGPTWPTAAEIGAFRASGGRLVTAAAYRAELAAVRERFAQVC